MIWRVSGMSNLIFGLFKPPHRRPIQEQAFNVNNHSSISESHPSISYKIRNSTNTPDRNSQKTSTRRFSTTLTSCLFGKCQLHFLMVQKYLSRSGEVSRNHCLYRTRLMGQLPSIIWLVYDKYFLEIGEHFFQCIRQRDDKFPTKGYDT